jgi:endonuclease YncB( thermonuclease family)
MKHITLLLILTLMLAPAWAATQKKTGEDLILPVLEIYDGDTIKTRLSLPNPLDKTSVRIYGIDTPEKPAASYAESGKLGRSKCKKEADLALKATAFMKQMFKDNGNMMLLKSYEWGKFGGRILADVYVLNIETGKQTNIADAMIDKGYAVAYFGEKKSKDWCK